MRKIKFGLIGLGNMGTQYLEIFAANKIENGICAAIADTNPERLGAASDKYAIKDCYNSGDELIEKADVDAVIVAVPHYEHPALSIHALERGLNVLCEKPAGVYAKQVKEMNAAAEKSKGLFTLMYNQRTNPLYIKMRELTAIGEIGDIRRVNWIITNWFRTQFYYDSGSWRATWRGEGGGLLINQCPHQLDLLQWISGMMPNKIHSFCHFGKWHDIETEDDVTFYFEFPNGATGTFVSSTADAPGTNRLEILGSRGRMICERDKLLIERSDKELSEFVMNSKDAFSHPNITAEVFNQSNEKNAQHAGIINNFANAILGTETLYVDGREGLKCVEIINAVLLSSWCERTVTLPVDEDEYLRELNKRIASSKEKATENIVIDNSMSYGGTK